MHNHFWGIKRTQRDNNVQKTHSANYFQIKTAVNKIRNTNKKDVVLPTLSHSVLFYSALILRNEIKRKMISL